MKKRIEVNAISTDDGRIVIRTNQTTIPTGRQVGGKDWWRQKLHILLYRLDHSLCDSAFEFNGGTITITKRDMDAGTAGNRPIIPLNIDSAAFMHELCSSSGIDCIGNTDTNTSGSEVLSLASA